jgi:hypothetical protein
MKTEWVRYRFAGGLPAVWHLPDNGTLAPACKSNGPVSLQVADVRYTETPPLPTCKHCLTLFIHRKEKFHATMP